MTWPTGTTTTASVAMAFESAAATIPRRLPRCPLIARVAIILNTQQPDMNVAGQMSRMTRGGRSQLGLVEGNLRAVLGPKPERGSAA